MRPSSSHKKHNIDLTRITEIELIQYKSFLELDPIRFEEEIFEIEQELLVRTLEYCKPVVDLVS